MSAELVIAGYIRIAKQDLDGARDRPPVQRVPPATRASVIRAARTDAVIEIQFH